LQSLLRATCIENSEKSCDDRNFSSSDFKSINPSEMGNLLKLSTQIDPFYINNNKIDEYILNNNPELKKKYGDK
jgi:hypothetical protein